jgi:Sulfotransferase domain
MLPTFFIIGATKAGTTSLSRYLDLHPDVHMASLKEPHFFVEPGDGLPTIEDRIGSVSRYESLFVSRARARGEASTSYSHYPARRGVPERIHARVPEARFIYLVRDPIDRVVSHYLHQVAHGGERRSIEAAIGDIDRPDNVYICASRYATQVARYTDVFPKDSILVIDHDDLRHRRGATMTTVFRFVGVDPRPPGVEFDREFNVTSNYRVYSYRYATLRHRLPLYRLPAPLQQGIRSLAERAEGLIWPRLDPPVLSDTFRLRLADMFREEVSRLRGITGKPFPTWTV